MKKALHLIPMCLLLMAIIIMIHVLWVQIVCGMLFIIVSAAAILISCDTREEDMARVASYHAQIEYLSRHPSEIFTQWMDGKGIFSYMTDVPYHQDCGDIIMIKMSSGLDKRYYPYTNGVIDRWMEMEIEKDNRIPDSPHMIRIGDLPVFLEWKLKHEERCRNKGRT